MIEMDYKNAMAAAQDAGDRNMRAAGRSEWSQEDWTVAADEFSRLMGYGIDSG